MNQFLKLIGISTLLALTSMSIFAQSGGVKGKVRSNKGTGVGNASVTARQSGKDVKTVRSDAKGVFQLTGLSTGVYSLVFDADGFQSGLLQGVEVKGGNVRDLGDRLILMPDQGFLVIVNGSIFYKEGTSLGPDEVGSHPASRSPFGLDDMAGNVLEWVRSSLGPEDMLLRGGCYFYDQWTARSTNRVLSEATVRDPRVGIRVCAAVKSR